MMARGPNRGSTQPIRPNSTAGTVKTTFCPSSSASTPQWRCCSTPSSRMISLTMQARKLATGISLCRPSANRSWRTISVPRIWYRDACAGSADSAAAAFSRGGVCLCESPSGSNRTNLNFMHGRWRPAQPGSPVAWSPLLLTSPCMTRRLERVNPGLRSQRCLTKSDPQRGSVEIEASKRPQRIYSDPSRLTPLIRAASAPPRICAFSIAESKGCALPNTWKDGASDADRGSSPPGSSRRAGGYSPVLRLTADEMSPPLFPCPKKFTFWDTTLLPRGTFWVRGPRPARSRTPQGRFPPARLLHQEEDAGPGVPLPIGPNGPDATPAPHRPLAGELLPTVSRELAAVPRRNHLPDLHRNGPAPPGSIFPQGVP